MLKIPHSIISGRKAKILDGFSSKINGKKITEFPSILIGQLGKNDIYSPNISGADLLDYCLAKIFEGQIRLGGRIIMLECKNIPYLLQLYETYGFNIIENDYHDGELIQMIRLIQEDEIIENN